MHHTPSNEQTSLETHGLPFKVDMRAPVGSSDVANLEAWTVIRGHAERLASALFKAHPEMIISITPSDDDPVEYLIANCSAIPVVRTEMSRQ